MKVDDLGYVAKTFFMMNILPVAIGSAGSFYERLSWPGADTITFFQIILGICDVSVTVGGWLVKVFFSKIFIL